MANLTADHFRDAARVKKIVDERDALRAEVERLRSALIELIEKCETAEEWFVMSSSVPIHLWKYSRFHNG